MRRILEPLSWLWDRRPRICVWLGFAVIFVLTMFPPWVGSTFYTQGARIHWRMGHSREDRDPIIHTFAQSSVDVDYRRMLAEIAVGECFVLALYLTWGRAPQKGSK